MVPALAASAGSMLFPAAVVAMVPCPVCPVCAGFETTVVAVLPGEGVLAGIAVLHLQGGRRDDLARGGRVPCGLCTREGVCDALGGKGSIDPRAWHRSGSKGHMVPTSTRVSKAKRGARPSTRELQWQQMQRWKRGNCNLLGGAHDPLFKVRSGRIKPFQTTLPGLSQCVTRSYALIRISGM